MWETAGIKGRSWAQERAKDRLMVGGKKKKSDIKKVLQDFKAAKDAEIEELWQKG